MKKTRGRAILAIAGAGVLGWWARLVLHSKTPPPEGRWREYEPPSGK